MSFSFRFLSVVLMSVGDGSASIIFYHHLIYVISWLLSSHMKALLSEDVPYRGRTSNGIFSFCSAYKMLHDQVEDRDIPNIDFNKVWRWKAPQRVRTFIWKAIHDPTCSMCQMQYENLMHILRDCDYATELVGTNCSF